MFARMFLTQRYKVLFELQKENIYLDCVGLGKIIFFHFGNICVNVSNRIGGLIKKKNHSSPDVDDSCFDFSQRKDFYKQEKDL